MHCTVREEVNRFPQQKQECFNSPLCLQFLLTAQIAAAHSGGCGISQNRPGYPTRGGSPVGRRGPCGPMGPGPRCHPPATLPDFNSPRGPLPALLRPGRNSGGLFFRTDWARGAHGVAVPLQQVASGGIGLGGTGRRTPQFSPLLTPQPAAARPDTFPHSSPISPPKITPPPQNNNNSNNKKSNSKGGSRYLPVPYFGKDGHPGCGLRIPRSPLVMDCDLPATPVGKSSPYLRRDSLTWP